MVSAGFRIGANNLTIPYQSVFGELYRRYRVASYRRIRQDQFADVMRFLDEWHATLVGADENQRDLQRQTPGNG